MNADSPQPAGDPYCDPPKGFRRDDAASASSSASSSTTSSPGWTDGAEPSPTQALRDAMAQVAELREYASYFIAAKLDGIKVSARKAGMYAALGMVALIALTALVVSGVVLLCWGAALGIGAIFGIPWLGALIMGVLVLGLIGLGAWLGMRYMTRSWRQQTIDKYEDRQRQQIQRFGHDVEERAHAARQHD